MIFYLAQKLIARNVISHCKLFGIYVNYVVEDKTVEPTEILAFLGIEFNTLAMELRLPSENLVELKHTPELFVSSSPKRSPYDNYNP
jgi:hypothetical protein